MMVMLQSATKYGTGVLDVKSESKLKITAVGSQHFRLSFYSANFVATEQALKDVCTT
jgi:hypothetical protein